MAGGQSLEQSEVGFAKCASTATIDRLENPEAPFISDKRSSYQGSSYNRARGHPGLLVDPREESRVRAHIVDLLRVSIAQHRTRNTALSREAKPGEAFGNFRIVLGNLREIELVALWVYKQNRDTFCIQ